MARTGRPKARLEVTAWSEENLSGSPGAPAHVALRAKIVLRCAHGESNVAVAAKLRWNVTVGKWRQRFTTGRVMRCMTRPEPPGHCPMRVEVLVATLESPKGRTHWIGARWRQCLHRGPHLDGLQPRRGDLRRPADREGAGHCRPLPESTRPRRCLVIRRKASDSSRASAPADHGSARTPDAQLPWHGGPLALNVSWRKPRSSIGRGISSLREIDERVDPTLTVHSSTISRRISPRCKRSPPALFHFTPTYSAWLNLVERFFGLLTEHALKRGSHSSTHALRHAISAYVDAHNDEGKPFKWTKTADEILAKVKRFGQRTVQVHGGPR